MLARDARQSRSTARLVLGIVAMAVALLVLAVATAPAATKKTKRKVDLVVKAARIATTGDSNTVAGAISGPPYGSGAVIYTTRPAGTDLAATYKAYTAKGTLRGTTLVTPAAQPDGSTSFTGTLQVTGGTGRYRGAKGKNLKVTGTFVPAENVFTFQIKGSVRY